MLTVWAMKTIFRSVIRRWNWTCILITSVNKCEECVFLAQMKFRRRRKGKGIWRERRSEREIGSEALAETEKIANAPAGNRTPDPSKRGWCSTIEPPRQATSPASLFEILSVLPPLHNIGIIQCPQLTNLLRSGDPSRSSLCITHWLKE